MYKSIMTSVKTIRLLGNHLIFARKNIFAKFYSMLVLVFLIMPYFWKTMIFLFQIVFTFKLCYSISNINRYATNVSPGDEVIVDRNDQLAAAAVINVTSTLMQGKLCFNQYNFCYLFFSVLRIMLLLMTLEGIVQDRKSVTSQKQLDVITSLLVAITLVYSCIKP